MPILAGADGCPNGWACVTRNTATGAITFALYPTAHALVFQNPSPDVLMIDIPIGLTNANGRGCDTEARQLLGHRQVCVFSAPIRPALDAKTPEEASRITHRIDGRRVSRQSWAIYPKIRQVDDLLKQNLQLQTRVFEVHPEVSFREWNNQQPVAHGKKTPQGRADRQTLIGNTFGNTAFATNRNQFRVGCVGHDDIADAFAALWTAERKAADQAICIPQSPPVDACGLRMEMWY